MSNNPTGKNGYGAKNCTCHGVPTSTHELLINILIDPPDDVLSSALHQYAKEHLGTKDQLARLKAEYGLDIKYVKAVKSVLASTVLLINMDH